MKHSIKVYIEDEDARKLMSKAHESGFNGRGALSYYISKIARERICFLNDDIINLLEKIKSQTKIK